MDEARRLSIIYQDMGTKQEVEAAAQGTVFEGSYPVEPEKQFAIVENLRWMSGLSSDPEMQKSCNRILSQALDINQKLSWS